jgi:hypothetical protein
MQIKKKSKKLKKGMAKRYGHKSQGSASNEKKERKRP